MKNIAVVILLFLFSGCSIKTVKPWQKALLSKKSMQDGGLNPILKKFSAHVYFSKEATKGGGGVAGGGCGCN